MPTFISVPATQMHENVHNNNNSNEGESNGNCLLHVASNVASPYQCHSLALLVAHYRAYTPLSTARFRRCACASVCRHNLSTHVCNNCWPPFHCSYLHWRATYTHNGGLSSFLFSVLLFVSIGLYVVAPFWGVRIFAGVPLLCAQLHWNFCQRIFSA